MAAGRRYGDEIGQLDWAAPQDWMCEPFIAAKTSLSVRRHLSRTVAGYLGLKELAPDLPIVPASRAGNWPITWNVQPLYEAAGVTWRRRPWLAWVRSAVGRRPTKSGASCGRWPGRACGSMASA